jgi:hypothetical protein
MISSHPPSLHQRQVQTGLLTTIIGTDADQASSPCETNIPVGEPFDATPRIFANFGELGHRAKVFRVWFVESTFRHRELLCT